MKMKSYRFSEETIKKIDQLALAEAILEEKQVGNTELLRRLVNKAFYKLKGK